MARRQLIQQSFAGGQITDALSSRDDLVKQRIGVTTCKNAIVTTIGSLKTRYPLKFISEVEDSTKRHRLIDFVFSNKQAYGCIFGHTTIWFIKDGAIVFDGGSEVEVATVYGFADLPTLKKAQSANVLYIVNDGSDPPQELTRTSDVAWTISELDFQDGPYRAFKLGDDDITLVPAARTGTSILVNASANMTWFLGQQIRFGYENPLDPSEIYWAWGTISTWVDLDTVRIDIEERLGYNFLLNGEFKNGSAFWEDRSTGSATVVVDGVTQTANFNWTGSGAAALEQPITVVTQEQMEITVVVDAVPTNCRVYIGTTAGASDILGIQNITTPGTYSYSFKPTQASIYVIIDNVGSVGTDVVTISDVFVARKSLDTRHWRTGAFGDSILKWPTGVLLFEGRLFFSGSNVDTTINSPDSVWASRTGEFNVFSFNTPLLDTDAIGLELQSNEVNAIQWMEALGEMVLGTTGTEWRLSRGSNSDALTPLSSNAKSKSNTGSASIQPVIAGKSLLFISRTQDKVHELAYSFDSDGFDPDDLTVLAPDLFKGYKIEEWAYQKSPEPIVWCVRDDGVLLGFTYLKKQDIWAWHVHETEGKFESVIVVPEETGDVVYVIVKRWLLEAGVRVAKRYVEMMAPRISNEDIYDYSKLDSFVTLDIENDISVAESITDIVFDSTMVWVHFAAGATTIADDDYIYISNVVGTTEINEKTFRVADKTSGADISFRLKDKEGDGYIDASQYTEYVSGGEIRKGITEFKGMEHLLGKTVDIIADGNVISDQTVIALDSGPATKWGVNLTVPAIVAHAGLRYTTLVKTLPLEIPVENGTSQGKDKTLILSNVNFNKTRYAEVGTDEDSLQEILFTDIDSGNNPPSLFVGVKETTFEDSARKRKQFIIKNDKPLPMEILGAVLDAEFSNK